MKLNKVLNQDVIALDLDGETKQEVIEQLLDTLVRTGKVSNRETALQDLLEREKKMSTGIQHGVAIPHAKTKAVKGLAACIGIHREGVDFDALDGEPSRIFVMTLSPVDRTGPHVQFLAEISMVLKSQQIRDQIVSSTDADAVLRLFGVQKERS